jgi:hypothetical protein
VQLEGRVAGDLRERERRRRAEPERRRHRRRALLELRLRRQQGDPRERSGERAERHNSLDGGDAAARYDDAVRHRIDRTPLAAARHPYFARARLRGVPEPAADATA